MELSRSDRPPHWNCGRFWGPRGGASAASAAQERPLKAFLQLLSGGLPDEARLTEEIRAEAALAAEIDRRGMLPIGENAAMKLRHLANLAIAARKGIYAPML